MIISLLTFAISFVLVGWMLPHVMILSLRKRLIDPIDARKVHSVPASRLGGVTFFPSICFSLGVSVVVANFFAPYVGMEVYADIKMILVCLSLFMLFLIGVYDDIVGASYRSKFLVQIISALFVISTGAYFKTFHGFLGIEEIPVYVGVPITLFFYVFATNAINLIDGIDGLASMLSMMALLVYAVLLYINQLSLDYLIAIATFGALLPFWYRNVFGIRRGVTSKIFMGDTGALVIGAILGYLAVTIWNISFSLDSNEPIAQIFYILSFTMLLVPCFDVVRIIVDRFLAHASLFKPDKNHIHHKFMALGASPKQALLCIVTVNLFFMGINTLLSFVMNFTYIVILDVILWTAMHLVISKKINNK